MIGVIGIFVAIPGVLLVANVPVLGVVLAGMLLYGFTRPFPDANMVPILCQIVDPRYLATGVGLLNMFAVLVGGVTIYVGGVVRDANINVTTLFNFGALGLVFCGIILWLVRPRPNSTLPSS